MFFWKFADDNFVVCFFLVVEELKRCITVYMYPTNWVTKGDYISCKTPLTTKPIHGSPWQLFYESIFLPYDKLFLQTR